MKKFVATIILNVEESTEGMKTDRSMIERFLKYSVKEGKICESAFRGNVILNVKDVAFNVMELE